MTRDRLVCMGPRSLNIDVCPAKAPFDGSASCNSSTDHVRQGTKRYLTTYGKGIPACRVITGANRHDSPLLCPTLKHFYPFGYPLQEKIKVRVDARYDIHETRDQ